MNFLAWRLEATKPGLALQRQASSAGAFPRLFLHAFIDLHSAGIQHTLIDTIVLGGDLCFDIRQPLVALPVYIQQQGESNILGTYPRSLDRTTHSQPPLEGYHLTWGFKKAYIFFPSSICFADRLPR